MTALCIASFLALIVCLEISHRREVKRLIENLGKEPRISKKMRHLSPHRKAIDAKRKINK